MRLKGFKVKMREQGLPAPGLGGLEAVEGQVDYFRMSQQGEGGLGWCRGSLSCGLEGFAKVIIWGKGGVLSSGDPSGKQTHYFSQASHLCRVFPAVHAQKQNRQTCVRKSLICAFAMAFIISVMLIAANQILRSGME